MNGTSKENASERFGWNSNFQDMYLQKSLKL